MPEDLDSWRDQNGRANHRTAAQTHFALLRMHATRFWFYGREWPEKRSPENKKKKKKKEKRERMEEKNETRGNMLEEKLFAWPTSGKGQHEGGDRHTVAAASRR